MRILSVVVPVVLAVLVLHAPDAIRAQVAAAGPRVELRGAPTLVLPGEVDSNSPAVWELVAGRQFLYVMTSFAGQPKRAWGRDLTAFNAARQVTLEPWPDGGVWMEAIVPDADGTWYGFYHNEIPAVMCRGSNKVVPRIGAARSLDRGATWEQLGIVLEAPPRTYDCTTENRYFVGGVGDFSVQLDPESQDLYIYYSLYLRSPMQQGIGAARMAWADRDAPEGRIMIWRSGAWLPASSVTIGEQERWIYPAASPVFPTPESWHDEDTLVDAFWGPSVHWNTHLERYVMLLNRAKDVDYGQEGIYVSYAPSLAEPATWSRPVKVLNGGKWYPQVLGLDSGLGTDRTAGEWARLFVGGTSTQLIHFLK